MRLFPGIWLWLISMRTSGFIVDGCESDQAKELVELLIELKTRGLSTFSRVTMFGCSDDKSQVARRLSRALVANSMHELDSNQFSWNLQKSVASTPDHHLLIVLEVDCPSSERLLLEAKNATMFVSPYKWFLISRGCSSVDCVLSKLSELRRNVLPDSELLIWLKQSQRLVSVYKVSAEQGRDWQIEERARSIACDNATFNLLLDDDSAMITSRRRSDLRRTHLKSSLVITDYDSLQHLTDYRNREIDTSSKCNYPWAKFLASMLNATISFKLAPTWGYPRANGTWDGMTGMMQRGEIEFGASHSFVTGERLKVVHYLAGLTTPSHSRFVFRRPALSSVANLFALPFRGSVWIGVLALALLFGFLLYPAMVLEWRRHRDGTIEPRVGDETIVVVGALAQQGFWYEARAASTRVLVLAGLLGFLSLHAAYAANIVALLQSTSSSIKSLKDLLASPLDLGVHDTVFNRYYFKSLGSLEPKIRGAISEKSEWLGLEEGVRRLRRGHFALHAVLGWAYKVVHETFEEDEKCDFEEIDFLNVFEPHMVVAKFSPYKELLRVKALRIRETGMRTREINRLYSTRPRCDAAASSRRFISVGYAECKGAFYALGYGLVVALLLFAAEIAHRRLRLGIRSNRLKR
uniref:Ionotropic receptor 75q2 n=1 Tax=Chouioia cunea TaxID=1570515 RepID=A0A6B9CRM2_9HYME|nr:ionotropic receptor 75q2 [Chouioia cunea]